MEPEGPMDVEGLNSSSPMQLLTVKLFCGLLRGGGAFDTVICNRAYLKKKKSLLLKSLIATYILWLNLPT